MYNFFYDLQTEDETNFYVTVRLIEVHKPKSMNYIHI